MKRTNKSIPRTLVFGFLVTLVSSGVQAGGTIVKLKTDASGKARVKLPARFDKITNFHLSYQLVVRFNRDRSDRGY